MRRISSLALRSVILPPGHLRLQTSAASRQELAYIGGVAKAAIREELARQLLGALCGTTHDGTALRLDRLCHEHMTVHRVAAHLRAAFQAAQLSLLRSSFTSRCSCRSLIGIVVPQRSLSGPSGSLKSFYTVFLHFLHFTDVTSLFCQLRR